MYLTNKPLLLLVDDLPDNLKVLESGLGQDYRLIMARNGERALHLARESHPDLILLDIMMPTMDGFEVCKQLKKIATTQDIPVIFLTALTDENNEIAGLALGAADYIYKPFNLALVRARIGAHLQASQMRMALVERAQASQERAEAMEQAARLREDVDHILRHDLKAPLSPILGFSEYLSTQSNLTNNQRDALILIHEAGTKMLGMINRSLDLYKMETGRYRYNPSMFNLQEIIQQVIARMTLLAEKRGVTIQLTGDDGAVIIPAEELLLHVMLTNLIQNAIEASSSGEWVMIRLVTKNPWLILTIANPALVPREIHGRFFEKYVTAGKPQGTGLGTYSARLMTETMGGFIEMTSEPGDGTRVIVTLPIAVKIK